MCKKDREQPARCCNCGGDHPASSTQCPTYKKALAEKQRKSKPTQRKTEAQTKYVPTPLPTRNAWDRRDYPALPTKAANVAPRNSARSPRRKPRPPRTRDPFATDGSQYRTRARYVKQGTCLRVRLM
ncbi:hypothetical protein Trydic_g14165 [Trypoxylus dichotomus]